MPPSSVSIQRCFQSSNESKESLGVPELRDIVSQAGSLTAAIEIPAGPASAFCGPTTETAAFQSVSRTSWAPNEATTSIKKKRPMLVGKGCNSWCFVADTRSGFDMDQAEHRDFRMPAKSLLDCFQFLHGVVRVRPRRLRRSLRLGPAIGRSPPHKEACRH